MTRDEQIKDHLDELKRILADIEEKHGTIQSANDYRYVKELHKQARWQVEQIEKVMGNV